MRPPTEELVVAAGVILELVATVRRLHMGAGDPRYRMRGCPVCRLVSETEAVLVDYLPPLPPPVPQPRRRLASVPEETDGD